MRPSKPLWRGLPLAGGRMSFAAIDILMRAASGSVAGTKRKMVVLGDAFSGDWGRDTLAASDLMKNLTEPRARYAGLDLTRPRIMGIVNVTPDSFSDGGQHASTTAAIDHGLRLIEEGADILDIGGESTRPGSDAVALDEELRRVIPVIEGLARQIGSCDFGRYAQSRSDAARQPSGRRHHQRRLGADA